MNAPGTVSGGGRDILAVFVTAMERIIYLAAVELCCRGAG